MPDKFNDDQGTRIAGEPTGAGAEPMAGTDGKPETSSQEHLSGYGGKGGESKEPSEPRDSRASEGTRGDGDPSDVPTSRR